MVWSPYLTMKLYYKDFVCIENAKVCVPDASLVCLLNRGILMEGIVYGSRAVQCFFIEFLGS